jgi:(5-formylfuran-3-yl)methyl phosphate synthase
VNPSSTSRIVAKLLVSVRSEAEAREALAGGAAIIDVKEPSRGSLGMASTSVWTAVRRAVPASVVVSVALGELSDWVASPREAVPPARWRGIAFRKLGLAGAGADWRDRWCDVRAGIDRESSAEGGGSPKWVAVAYLDWETAWAPDPAAVIAEAAEVGDCVGVLFDTWDKSRRMKDDAGMARWIGRAREMGRFVALAGSLDEPAIRRLRPLEPDLFAVRGAACRGGDRNAPVDRDRVARLVEAVRQSGG